jgi:hypothetical protein
VGDDRDRQIAVLTGLVALHSKKILHHFEKTIRLHVERISAVATHYRKRSLFISLKEHA